MSGSTGTISPVVSRTGELLDGVFVSVTSDQMVDHGRSTNGPVSLSVDTDSIVTITAHKPGFKPRTKIMRFPSDEPRAQIELTERTNSGRGLRSRPPATGNNSDFIRNQEEFDRAQESIDLISKWQNDPREVYRELLVAHQSLCTVLGSINRTSKQKSVRGQSIANQIDSLESDIEALESYADLLSSNLDALEAASDSTDVDEKSMQYARSTQQMEQVREFVTEFDDLPPVGKTDGLNGKPLARFGDFVAEWLESPSHDKEKSVALLEDVERLAEELERVPSHDDVRENGRYNLQTYYEQFGSWLDVIEASEIDHREKFLDDVRSVQQRLGKQPTIAEYEAHGKYTPSRLKRVFGTWSNTLEAVESAGERRKATSDGGLSVDERREVMLSVIVGLHDDLGRVPKASHLPDDIPFTPQDYVDEFGGWYEAVAATELDYQEELLQDIRQVTATLGHSPSTVEMDEHGTYDHNDVYRFFDTWGEAIEAAMGDTAIDEVTADKSESERSRKPTTDEDYRDRMLAVIRHLYDELGRVPKASHLPDDSPFIPQDYVDEFGGWYDALERAGLDHRGEVLEEIRDVTAQLGHSPTTGELGEYGRYDSGDVYRHFDTWGEAKEAAGVSEIDDHSSADERVSTGQDDAIEEGETEHEQELLEAVRSVARRLGRSPSLADLDAHSEYDHNDVYARFDSWGDVKRIAGVSTEPDAPELLDREDTIEPTGSSDDTQISTSKLAELYDAFFHLSRIVDGIVELTDSPAQGSPMAAWRDALHRFVQDGTDDWENGYGPRQGASDIKINRYRDAHGDGEHVTEFHGIETAPMDPVVETVIDRLDIDEQVQPLRLPVAPDTGVAVPIFVESERELEQAETLLDEFPERPSIDEWEWVSEGEERVSDDVSDEEAGATSEGVDSDALLNVSGVTESEADSLTAAGFESVEDLRTATVDEISETDGISTPLALRIKADIGGQ